MKGFCASIAVCLGVWTCVALAAAPEIASPQAPAQATSAPTIVRVDGDLKTPNGEPRTGTVVLLLSIYADQQGGAPLWGEQHVAPLDNGKYTVLAGSTQPEGIPKAIFLSDSARWVGVAVQGEAEQPRIMLITVPYAMKAQEAATLAGKSATDFVLSANLRNDVESALKAAGVSGTPNAVSGASNTVTTLNVAGNPPQTLDSLHVVGGQSGATALPGLDQIVLENSTTGGMSILTPDANLSEIVFGSPSDTFGAVARWDFSNKAFSIGPANTGADTVFWADNASEKMRIRSTGNVGIGTPTPSGRLHIVQGPSGATAIPGLDQIVLENNTTGGMSILTPDANLAEIVFGTPADNFGALLRWDFSNKMFSIGPANAGADMVFWADNASEKLRITSAGNIGIGTSTPASKLHVVGDAHVTGNTVVDGNIAAKYQDVAEWVETPAPLEPGTVVIVDPVEPNRVLPAARAYDTRVAGAVSRQPGLVLGERSDTKAMVAQSGRVRVKADAKYGAIKIGDLLVTSPTPGYAMRSRPMRIGGQKLHRPGTLLGKALEALPTGKGDILVLLTLQ